LPKRWKQPPVSSAPDPGLGYPIATPTGNMTSLYVTSFSPHNVFFCRRHWQ